LFRVGYALCMLYICSMFARSCKRGIRDVFIWERPRLQNALGTRGSRSRAPIVVVYRTNEANRIKLKWTGLSVCSLCTRL